MKSEAVLQETWDEVELVKQAQKGSLDAFNALILYYQTRVYNLARYILRDDAAADDMAQETFIAAYRSLPNFKGGSFQGWILRIVTNRCYDVLRRHKRYPTTSWEDFTDIEEAANPYMVDEGPTPEETLEQNDLRDMLDRGLSILPDDQRLVIVLVDRLGCNYDDVMRITGVPLGTVKSRLYRARTRMREFLLEEDLLPAQYRQDLNTPSETGPVCGGERNRNSQEWYPEQTGVQLRRKELAYAESR